MQQIQPGLIFNAFLIRRGFHSKPHKPWPHSSNHLPSEPTESLPGSQGCWSRPSYCWPKAGYTVKRSPVSCRALSVLPSAHFWKQTFHLEGYTLQFHLQTINPSCWRCINSEEARDDTITMPWIPSASWDLFSLSYQKTYRLYMS